MDKYINDVQPKREEIHIANIDKDLAMIIV